jgi:hypothetical protein
MMAGGAKAAGGMVAGGAKAAGSQWVSGAKAIGRGAVNTAAIHAKHPVAGLVKAPLVNVKNEYKKTFNDPSKNGAKDTMKTNMQRAPVKSTLKVAAGATGALAPFAAAKGLAQPGKSLQTNRNMKADAAEKKMGGLSWTPPGKAPGPAGARPPMGRPRY